MSEEIDETDKALERATVAVRNLLKGIDEFHDASIQVIDLDALRDDKPSTELMKDFVNLRLRLLEVLRAYERRR